MQEIMERDEQGLPDEDTEMENLPGTGLYPPQTETRLEEEIITPGQIAFPQDMEEEREE